jgi:ABC-type sugar transport system substrate-binding protein/HPt (histidine-containing phosphotransfer) domain-containing protein
MPHIGLVLGNPKLGTYIWTMVGSCFRSEAAQRQVAQTTLPARTVTEEVAALARLVGQGVDVIVLKPLVTDDPELLRGLDRVDAARIPVITLDSGVDHPAVVCTVGLDNWQAQALAASCIFDRLQGRGQVVFLGADPRAASGAARNASFHDLLGRYPGVRLVYEANIDWVTPVSRRAQGAVHMRAALDVAPDLDAVVASNDEAALGAIDVFDERGLSNRLVSGYDGLPDGLLAVHDRRMTATIRQGPLAIARTAIDVALSIARGEVVPRRADVPVELVTAANAVEATVNALRFMPALIADLTENHEQQRRTLIALAAAKERLEERVAERTQELDARNRKLRVVLDHVGQALFTVDLEGRVSQERSAAFDTWFPGASAGTQLWTILEPINPDAAAWASIAWEQLRDGWLPLDVAIEQLPRKLLHQGRHYEISYRPINGAAGLEQVLVVISDVTEAVGLAQSEADQRERLEIFQQVVNSREEFFEFFAECERLMRAMKGETQAEREAMLRALHTLKGICAMRGIASMVSICHALEKKLVQSAEPLDLADRDALTAAWSAFSERVGKLTGSIAGDRVELARADLRGVRDALEAGRSHAEVLELVRRIEQEPAAHRLERLAEDARALARRLGKPDLDVTVECDDVRFDRQRWAPFWSALVHMLRNAVDHGIEPAEERVALGKPKAGRLALRAREADGEVTIEIADDGRGVNWESIQRQTDALGHGLHTEAELLQALLRGGLSTKQTTTEISGRGVGVSACARACEALDGHLSLSSTPGQGTTFHFRFPSQSVQSTVESTIDAAPTARAPILS